MNRFDELCSKILKESTDYSDYYSKPSDDKEYKIIWSKGTVDSDGNVSVISSGKSTDKVRIPGDFETVEDYVAAKWPKAEEGKEGYVNVDVWDERGGYVAVREYNVDR